jgi:hypothetical protein
MRFHIPFLAAQIRLINDKVDTPTRQKVPGKSPAYYIGDSKDDILVIDSLDQLSYPIDP